MAGPRGIEAVAKLAQRAKSRRGGKEAVREEFARQAPDSLVVWRDAYLESLAARNYSEQTREGRHTALRHFLARARQARHDSHLHRGLDPPTPGGSRPMPSLGALARSRPTGRFQRMTAVEVIDEIKALPPQEKAKVIDFVQRLESTQPRVRTLDPRAFEQAARSVFQRHDELMQKLSQ